KGTPEEVFAHPSLLAASNIKPPVLAELFEKLRAQDPTAPPPALTVDEAAQVLAEWRRGGSGDQRAASS
ncbi:MAG: hypothetical protein LLG24_01125, partial [Actinomycetia bacterium]|nr:hypothetical protein [Actinomycetes bacterium]